MMLQRLTQFFAVHAGPNSATKMGKGLIMRKKVP